MTIWQQNDIKDRPAVIGPFDNSELVCLECYKPMEELYPCSICSLPLCSKDCENKPRHSIECKYFKNTKPNFTECERSTIYSSIAPIRMLEIQKENGYIWSLVNRLEDHLQERRRGEPWTFLQETVFPFMEKYCEQDYSLNDLERIIGIFRTNSVKWEDKVGLETRPVGHALCPVFSVLCHSCVNNTRYTIEDGLITVRACIPIQAGDEITTQYRGPNDGNILRRPDFKKNWLFDCSCVRCQDPTELGTHSSTLKCFKCREPTLYPRTSDLESEWECRSCGDIVTHSQALEITLRFESLLYGKLYSDPPPSWEIFIDDLEKYLHPTHFICMKAKRLLLQIYGSRDGYTLDKMSKEQLERKIQLCNNYIGKQANIYK
ncbi:protein msta [Eurytemora carolleeae]|uniref:protein msta n=1 Tax=Eurytemora carolleeae TaxID=1294199 RepID=UPI000C780D33|nr:protein msta [Eurytemora carolleeae]|eukprot:XP_023331997.1 protein msta-like [Eurytemora affinis]